MSYTKQTWIDGQSPLNAERMNHIEDGIYQNAEEVKTLSEKKLDAKMLPEAIEEALRQAKESGEFKGDKGDTGDPGPQGIPGPQGEKGEPGSGEDVTAENIKAALGYVPANENDIPDVPDWALKAEKPTYTADEVGADPLGAADQRVGEHNISENSHYDIRLFIDNLAQRINGVLDSDDTTLDQMSEIVAYIKSNKSLIDNVTTQKVNVSDIVNNITTNVSDRPLSAAMGAALKQLIDALAGEKLDAEMLPEAIEDALRQAKESGEFKGDKGDTGPQGPKGDTGETGAAGKDGKDGTSVTVASVSESAADGGSNVVTFSDGKILTVKNGSKGDTGATGPAGPQGEKGSDASVTAANIKAALGYTPANDDAVRQINDYIHITPGTSAEKAENIIGDSAPGWTEGVYIQHTSGNASTNAGYIGSANSIPISGASRIFARYKNAIIIYPQIAFYDSNNRYISGAQYTLSSADEREEYQGMYGMFYTVPENAAYFKASYNKSFAANIELYIISLVEEGARVEIPDIVIPASAIDGKIVVCFGDSLFGMYRGADSAPAFIAAETGAIVHNVGFGGCRMSVHPSTGYAAFSMWALAKAVAENNWTTQDAQASSGSGYFPEQLALLKSIDFSEVDIVVIHYGTNDFGAGNAIALDNANDHDDYNTLCGALRYSIEKLLGAYPGLRIYVSLPVYRFWTENGVNVYAETYLGKSGKVLPEFVEALRSTAAEYNLPVIDGYYGLGINKANAAAYLPDGTHHNAAGRERFGRFIGSNLIAQQTTGKSGTDGYSKSEIDAIMGSYITDINDLVGGDG